MAGRETECGEFVEEMTRGGDLRIASGQYVGMRKHAISGRFFALSVCERLPEHPISDYAELVEVSAR
jgi:hypothetical protein